MTTDVIERLQGARDRIADPEHWIAGDRWSPDNKRNCALGAVEWAYGATCRREAYRVDYHTIADDNSAPIIRLLAQATGDPNWEESPQYAIANFNNRQGHHAVIEMFNRAIELAIAELVTESPSA